MFQYLTQPDDYSCGRVCCQMVLRSVGIPDGQYIDKVLAVDPHNGTYQKSIVEALTFEIYENSTLVKTGRAKAVSFKRFSKKKVLETIKEMTNSGWLAIVSVDNGDHWLVVRKIHTRVEIADPWPNTPRTHGLDVFANRAYKGSAIFFTIEDKHANQSQEAESVRDNS